MCLSGAPTDLCVCVWFLVNGSLLLLVDSYWCYAIVCADAAAAKWPYGKAKERSTRSMLSRTRKATMAKKASTLENNWSFRVVVDDATRRSRLVLLFCDCILPAGALSVTNLRIMWVSHADPKTNLSIGLGCVASLTVKLASSRWGFRSLQAFCVCVFGLLGVAVSCCIVDAHIAAGNDCLSRAD